MVMMRLQGRRPGWGLTPWGTFKGFECLEGPLGHPPSGRLVSMPCGLRSCTDEVGWPPALDVYDRDDRFLIHAELPGVEEDDLDVSVADNTVTIKGRRTEVIEAEDEGSGMCKRTAGSFFRSVTLPSAVDTPHIEASYQGGVLEIILPKVLDPKAKKEIRISLD